MFNDVLLMMFDRLSPLKFTEALVDMDLSSVPIDPLLKDFNTNQLRRTVDTPGLRQAVVYTWLNKALQGEHWTNTIV